MQKIFKNAIIPYKTFFCEVKALALTFRGGVSLYCGSDTRDKQTRIFDAPSTVCVSVPEGCTPTVKKGDAVSIGQVIGDGRGSRVHASI